MYNKPREATVKSTAHTVLWALTREAFNGTHLQHVPTCHVCGGYFEPLQARCSFFATLSRSPALPCCVLWHRRTLCAWLLRFSHPA